MREALRAAAERALAALWYAPPGAPRARWAGLLLWPLSTLVAKVAARRREATHRLDPRQRPAVVVVGNLTVGGTGKTPATIAIATALAARGWHVGLLCAGYRAARRDPRMVGPGADPDEHGDEAVLLAQGARLPVAAGRRRAETLGLLLREHPELDLVVSDDGLQHAALSRTLEFAVFDRRGAGNARVLPAGPLRERLQDLARVDAVLLNGVPSPPGAVRLTDAQPAFRFDVEPTAARSLATGERIALDRFAGRFADRRVAALAGIGDPARFFAALRAAGLRFHEHPRGDHARYDAAALAAIDADVIVMTGKDAVKCATIADWRCWVVETEARLDPAAIDWIEERLRGHPTA